MNNENNETIILLRGIKRWVIAGALGFILIGLGVIVVTVSIVQTIFPFGEHQSILECSSENTEYYYDDVNDLIDQGKLEEALNLINQRLKTHPNDESAHWLKARAHYLNKDWKATLEYLIKIETISPGFNEHLTKPMREKVETILNDFT